MGGRIKKVKFWARFDAWFIADALAASDYTLYKGRVLAMIHLCTLLTIGTTQILTFLTPENEIGFVLPTVIALALPIIFKKYGNLNLSGNLLAAGVACILAPMVFESGGLYSDNLLWMILCPLVVMLFCQKNMAFSWVLGLLVFASYLYGTFDPNISDLGPNMHDPTYYFISISLLCIIVVVVVYLFKKGEEDTIRDLQRKKIELEFKSQALMDANMQLRQISEQLQASNSDLESFAYAASHDLKEPLRMIGSYTQLIERRLKDSLTPDTSEMMAFVKDGVNRMQKLLDDVLEYSRAGRGQDKMIEVDLEDVLYYIKTSLHLRIEEKGATIVVPEPLPSIYARYSSMVQLFQNLLTNAIKFSKENVPPEVVLTWKPLPDGFVEFRITDNGIGIEKKYQEKVFNLFERLHYRQDYAGSGIGLSTCKKIVENMGGTIEIESEVGKGTSFILCLPFTEETYKGIFKADKKNSQES